MPQAPEVLLILISFVILNTTLILQCLTYLQYIAFENTLITSWHNNLLHMLHFIIKSMRASDWSVSYGLLYR